MHIPYWLLKLLPLFDYVCPKCRKEVKQKSHTCIHCGENYGVPVRVPPRMLKDPKALEEYVHKHVFPRVSPLHRIYLTQFFTVLFSDGFEPPETNLFENWTATSFEGAGVSVIEAVNPHHETKNMKSTITVGAADNAYIYRTIAATNICYMRGYIKLLDVLPSVDGAGYGLMTLSIGFLANGDGLTVSLVRIAGANYWNIETYNNAWASDWNDNEAIASNPSLVTWYCLEILRDVTNDLQKLWVNGVLKIDVAHAIAGGATRAYCGTHWTNINNTNIAFDCIVVADAYIGPEGGAPTPKGTIAVHAKIAQII